MSHHPLQKVVGKALTRISTGKVHSIEELFEKGEEEETWGVIGLLFTGTEEEDSDFRSGGQVGDWLERVANFHRELREKKNAPGFQVIHIPLDEKDTRTRTGTTTPEQKTKNNLPFFAIHGEHSKTIQEYLIRKFGVQPQSPATLILIDSTSGAVINFQGTAKISSDPGGTHFPWKYPLSSDVLRSGHLITSDATNPSSKEHQVVNASTISGFIKGYYFAAYWCPPCRNFGQLLQDAYKRIKTDHKQFEIIFVSSDRSLESFQRHFSTQPWVAIPFEDDKRREDLTSMFNIKTIPSLVLVDKDDSIITWDGRSEIVDDSETVDFPWHPKQVEELRDRHTPSLNHDLCLICFCAGNEEEEYDKAEDIFTQLVSDFTNSDIEEALHPKFFIATDSELAESLRVFMDLEEGQTFLVAIQKGRYAVAKEGHLMRGKQIREFIRKFQSRHPALNYKYFPSSFI